MALSWKAGFEIELLMPRGRSRRDLAERVARRQGGSVVRFFHPQSEPSEVKGRPTFENLTAGFEARDSQGRATARFVDDLTLQADLDRKARPKGGWYRIVSDDGRLLRLLMRQCDPDAALESVLQPIAALFGTFVETHPSGMMKVSDERGISVAIAAPLPGERERTCEIVTPPLERDHERRLAEVLAAAREEGCSLPREGALHIHFDAGPLTSAPVVAAVVRLFSAHGEALKRLVGTNPNCIRLGNWPEALLPLVSTAGFQALDWPAARQALTGVGLSKYCDFNLLNLASANAAKHTLEVRILATSMDAEAIVDAAELFAAILERCSKIPSEAAPADLADLLASLPLHERLRRRWSL